MAADLILTPEAERDVEEAYSWYERQRVGLGEAFLGSVDATLEAICRTPRMHAHFYLNYRRALLRRFPYAIFYEETESAVSVHGIFHTARDPRKWRDRLP